jgi:glucose/arabinose dehydrogenase
MRFKPDGRDLQVFARGLRNSVGFDWAPWNSELYATDNGRDMLGDNFPPCELNRLQEGGFYGWPYLNGDGVPDPDLGAKLPAALEPIAPVHAFAAHNAPLGIHFLTQPAWQRALGEKTALVALHGSWNRSVPDGYKVVSLHWQDDEIEERDFVTGFLTGGEIIGRPVDVATAGDGAVYISDDYAGAVYRVVLDQ